MSEWEYIYVKVQYGGYTAWTMEAGERQPIEWGHREGALPLYEYLRQLRTEGWLLFEDSPRRKLFMFRRLKE